MPAFQAINLEPEESLDEQIDTTKELHVDEALKRFQNALKLHAQGPRSREAARAAYENLFRSEIFKYREATTEYDRAERQADGGSDQLALESFAAGLDLDAGGADGVAASLSLALYLSYKNYGQFFLDKLKDVCESDPEWEKRSRILYDEDHGDEVINNWTAALDQDPSDPEVWRRVARFAASMNSARVKRYCLEAAVELDDDPAVMEVEPPSLAEGLAGEQLMDHLQLLGDDVALSHPVMAPWLDKDMPALIKRHLDPISFLPDPTCTLTPPPSSPLGGGKLLDDAVPDADAEEPSGGDAAARITTWSGLGSELISCVEDTPRAFLACKSALGAPQGDEKATATQDESQPQDAAEPTQAGISELEKSRGDKEAGQGGDSETQDKEKSKAVDETNKPSAQSQKERSLSLPTRKRSQSTAGLPEGADEENPTEKRSKRIRRRDTAHGEELADQTAIVNQLQPYREADQHLFLMTKTVLESLGVQDESVLNYLGEVLDSCTVEDRHSKITRLAAKDLRSVMTNYSEDIARTLLSKKEQATLGLSSFLEHAKSGSQEQITAPAFNDSQGIGKFAEMVDSARSWMTADDIAFSWVQAVSEGYTESNWSETLKLVVVQMLNRWDAVLYERISEELEQFSGSPSRLAKLETIVPMLFELHIDIYERITNPSSVVDYATRVETKHRLARWLDVASAYVRLFDRPPEDPLCVRFMWGSVMASSLSEDPVREHILLLWTSLRDFLAERQVAHMTLPNNLVMSAISPAAADREISKLTTMDFFLGLFQEEMEDPVHVIETLEPVLNPASVRMPLPGDKTPEPDGDASTQSSGHEGAVMSENASQGLRDLWKFLESSSAELRLFLWSRLGDAYEAIKYTTKKFSCLLKSIELIVGELESENYAKTPEESRRLLFMRTLKSLDELLIKALSMGLNDSKAFEIIDEEHLRTTAGSLAKASCMLHVAALCEDEVRTGITTAPSNSSTFHSLITKMREMQVRTWCLQYTMLKARVPLQGPESVPEGDLADYLAAVHHAIGMRKFCKSSNKIFLKMMRVELLKLKHLENWEDYMGQVLYDLYGLKLGVGIWEVQEHDCPHETLEKRQTMHLVGKVVDLANRMPMKELLKSELKNAIDNMQQSIGQTKSTAQMIHNLRNFTEYLKKPIHPLKLYQSLVGRVSVDTVSVNTQETALAKHGWFFLLGMIALTKFKAVDLNRRQTPGATDDLRIGATFLRLQLQFTAERWDAWFRLAECFDYELDEAVLWTADKINKDRGELVKFQRNAIHCYTLALSHSRHAEIDTHDGDPLHDLYHKFGMRLYSSSREPFAMEPFQHSDQERYFIESMGAGTFKKILHEEMTEYKVWKFAARLFRMAIERKPDNWKNPYMLAKCYWKMHQTPVEALDRADKNARISTETVLDALKKAVQVANNARRSRSSEPILEPHYKIVSVLHKMVMRGDISSADAAKILSEQPLGIPVSPDDHFASFSEPEDWEEYIIRNLTKLRDKDKSNWHHRIIMRHARILFDEGNLNHKNDLNVEAKAAFAILRESMFTKTMVANVWKCDAERPGRHHVYTEQYVRFMTNLLVIMSDRMNLDLLLRRLRKKGADFYHFTDLWQTCCLAYVKLLRQAYQVAPMMDEVFKTMSIEEFEIMTERITDWAAGDGPHIAVFACMRDAVEVKKLNANLMRALAIDELINDCYSRIYLDVASDLPGLDPTKVIEERARAKEIAAKLEAASQAEPKPLSSLSSILNPPTGEDSVPGASTPLDAEKSEAAPRARKPGVRRADVLRKAEQAVARSMEAPKPASIKSRVGSMSSGKRGSQTPNLAASDDGSADDGDASAQAGGDGEENSDAEMRDHDANNDGSDGAADESKAEDKDDGDSEAGSIHDSADDESDLSDVPDGYDEEVPPGLMFPNLGRAQRSGASSGEEADSESEGDEAGEADGDEADGDEADEGGGEEEEDEAGASVGEDAANAENEDTSMAEAGAAHEAAVEGTPGPEL